MAAFLAAGLTSNLLGLGSGHLWEYIIEQKDTHLECITVVLAMLEHNFRVFMANTVARDPKHMP